MSEEDTVLPDDTGTADESGAKQKSPAPVPYARFQEVVKQRRDIETKLTEAEKALTAAETAKIEAMRKYDELDTSTKAAIESLNAKIAVTDDTLTKYKEIVSATVSDTTKEWPEEVLMFDPGADADPATRLEWAQKAKLLVAKLNPALQQAGAGTSPKPLPKQSAADQKQITPSVDIKRNF